MHEQPHPSVLCSSKTVRSELPESRRVRCLTHPQRAPLRLCLDGVQTLQTDTIHHYDTISEDDGKRYIGLAPLYSTKDEQATLPAQHNWRRTRLKFEPTTTSAP